MAFEVTMPVRFGDVDHAGIVYYPQFFIYFHEAFEDFFNQSDYPYATMLDRDRIGWPTVRIEVDYKAPLRYGDLLRIRLTLKRLGGRSVTIAYQGHRVSDGTRAVTALITTACVDLDTFASRDIPDTLRALFGRIGT